MKKPVHTPFQNSVYNGFVLPDNQSYSGRCLRKTEMVTRGLVEAASCKTLVFITLTYSPEFLPLSYKRVRDLKIFRPRKSRRKVPILQDNDKFKDKWIEINSRPLNVGKNTYRTKELMTEYDFKNAKMRARLNYGYDSDNPHLGLLVPEHLSTFLSILRDECRKYSNNDSFTLRYIANGEYGQHTHRPHYHLVIFDNLDNFPYYEHVKAWWYHGKILQVQRVSNSKSAVKKLTAYIVGHTVKNDQGNQYQCELSPAFRLMSNHNGGIGRDLLNPALPFQIADNPFITSLSFSLLNWDKRSPLKMHIVDDSVNGLKPTIFEYEFSRYYKDKVLNYHNLSDRDYFTSMCQMVHRLISNFCQYHGFHGDFDLLPVFSRIGTFGSPHQIVSWFIQTNYKLFPESLHIIENIDKVIDSYFDKLRNDDTYKSELYKKKYSHRHQEKKYLKYLEDNHFEIID